MDTLMRAKMRPFTFLLAFVVLAGCDNPPPPTPVPSPSPVPPTPTSALSACAVTVPNGSLPPDMPGVTPMKAPCPSCHGNGSLWTDFPPDGRVPATSNSTGALESIFGWWEAPGITDVLTVQGRRIDAPARPLLAQIPAGLEGGGFHQIQVVFPTAGCWEITGKAGTAGLTFVVQVVKGQ